MFYPLRCTRHGRGEERDQLSCIAYCIGYEVNEVVLLKRAEGVFSCEDTDEVSTQQTFDGTVCLTEDACLAPLADDVSDLLRTSRVGAYIVDSWHERHVLLQQMLGMIFINTPKGRRLVKRAATVYTASRSITSSMVAR